MKLNNTLNQISKITSFALPISAGMLINMISSFISMTFVARLGKVELAAGALAVSTYITLLTVFSTIFYALGILISHYRAQGKTALEIGEFIKNSFWLALFLAIPALIPLWDIQTILLLFKQDPHLVSLTHYTGPVGLRFGFMSDFIIAAILLWWKLQDKIQQGVSS